MYHKLVIFAAVPPPAYFPGAGVPTGYPGGPAAGGYPGGPAAGGYPGGPPQMPGFKPFPAATPYAGGGGESGFGTSYGGYGTSDPNGANLAFSDKTIRNGFIRYRIVSHYSVMDLHFE